MSKVVFSGILIIWILTTSILITINPLTVQSIYNYGHASYSLLPFITTVDLAARPLINLMTLATAKQSWNQLETPTGLAFTAKEIDHLIDVKRIVDNLRVIMVLSSAILLIVLRRAIQPINQLIITSIKILLATLGLVSLITLVAWDYAFTLFHQIFFPQGNWAFPANSLLITLFPVEFWQAYATLLVITICAVCLVIAIWARRNQPKSHGPQQYH